ncbi:hypothetical protein L195_g026864 [Trifolium pratense]|uniref:Uncharacterized protein n=1 Tax=Trifolium pratense TaxID=57577 RepID=A0A2K3NKF2_TRIPR|nr:hypothetical protein L195_g026864 [Trifolium pratense]
MFRSRWVFVALVFVEVFPFVSVSIENVIIKCLPILSYSVTNISDDNRVPANAIVAGTSFRLAMGVGTLSIPLVKNGNIIHNPSARMQFTHRNNKNPSSLAIPPDQYFQCRDLESESVSLDLSKGLQRVDIKLVKYTITNMLHWSSLKFFIYGRLINYADIKRRLFVRLYVVNSLNTKCFNLGGVFVAYGLKKLSAIPPRKIVLFCNGWVAIQQTHFGMEEPSTFCSNFLQELKKIGQVVEGYSYYVNDYFSDDTQLVFCLHNYIHSFILDVKDSSGNLICMDTNITSMVCNALVQQDGASIFKSTTSHNLETHNLFHVLGLKLFTTKYVVAYSSPERSQLVLNQFAFVAVFHRKMINRGNVRDAKILIKWKTLPRKHGTCDYSSLRTRMFEGEGIVTRFF